jgi:hypothetical protein
MSVTIVVRCTGAEDHTALLKEEAPLLKRHGAVSAPFASAMDTSVADPDYL